VGGRLWATVFSTLSVSSQCLAVATSFIAMTSAEWSLAHDHNLHWTPRLLLLSL
jgi:hypothetical protein